MCLAAYRQLASGRGAAVEAWVAQLAPIVRDGSAAAADQAHFVGVLCVVLLFARVDQLLNACMMQPGAVAPSDNLRGLPDPPRAGPLISTWTMRRESYHHCG